MKVFKPDKMNGFDVQTEADAMLERQTRDLMPKLTPQTPKTPQISRIAYVLKIFSSFHG